MAKGRIRSADEKLIDEIKALAKPYLGKIAKFELAAAEQRSLMMALVSVKLAGHDTEKATGLLEAAGIVELPDAAAIAEID